MGDIIPWLVIGLIAGGAASFLIPGRTPGSVSGAVIIGVLGGVFGGWVLDGLDIEGGVAWVGALVVATIGAVVLLVAMRLADRSDRL